MKIKLCAGLLLLAVSFAQAQDDSKNVNGRVVDDSTGEPVIDLEVQTGTTNLMQLTEIFWQTYMIGNARNPGRFSARFRRNELVRIIAPGYLSQLLTEPSLSNLPVDNLEIRLKRSEEFQGVVLDNDERPVAGARVLLATMRRVYLTDGKLQYGEFRGSSTNTDDAGRFGFRGEGDALQKVVIVSSDGNLVWPAVQSELGQDMKITLPKPGNLIVHYDIPGDEPEAKPEIYLITTNKDRSLWKDISFGLSCTVMNSGETVLTNLTPGTYNFRRYKTDGGRGAESEQQTIVVEAGQTSHADMVRTNGQHISGKVLGLDEAKASGGYIYVKSADATGLPWPQRSRNEQNEFKYRTFDVSQFGADGTFQTTMLEPGTYTVAADVYPPGDGHTSGSMRNSNPDYVAVAKVTVTAEAMPPVTLKL